MDHRSREPRRAQTNKMGMSIVLLFGVALAKAHSVTEEAAKKSVEAVKKVGFSTEDAIHCCEGAVDRLMIADMSLSKAEGLAKVAKDAAAIENITPGTCGAFAGLGFLLTCGTKEALPMTPSFHLCQYRHERSA